MMAQGKKNVVNWKSIYEIADIFIIWLMGSIWLTPKSLFLSK